MFSNAVHPLLASLEAELTLGYLDDVTLGGHQNEVAKDVERIVSEGHNMGLLLNVSKCELIADSATTINDPVLQTTNCAGFQPFRSPIVSGIHLGQFLDGALQ